MSKIFVLILLAFSFMTICNAQVTWLSELADAKRASKLYNKPVLVWVGIPGFRTRPMELTDEKFVEAAKKIICVNLDPRHMSDEERETYAVNDSNANRIYYYDMDFVLLHSEECPPKGLLGGVSIMLKSVEAKKEKEKESKENKKVESESDKLWNDILSLEANEQYQLMVPKLKLMSTKFPSSPYSEQAKDKLEKIKTDPAIVKIVENQKKESSAAKLYRSAEIFIDNKKEADAKEKLNQLLKDYPDTKVASDAKELLDKLK